LKRYFLLGPTAAGKSGVALRLAPRLDAEILSMDSMLVYRGMDVGAAKPDAAERAAVPHHLLDLVGPEKEFSAARWVAAAQRCEAELSARGRHALYVGGTALYLKALLHGLPTQRTVPAEVRAAVRREWEEPGGPARLRAEFARVDPQAAARIHADDAKRILRALEHARAFGEPWSTARAPWPASGALGVPAVALRWPRAELHARIAARFARMMEEGFLAEVQRLRAHPGFGPTARLGIGYRELLRHLDGEWSLAEAVQHAQRATRVLVRRQETWLRSFPDLVGVECGAGRAADAVADAAAAALTAR
jgi:tRNA dimethylallyltransferase